MQKFVAKAVQRATLARDLRRDAQQADHTMTEWTEAEVQGDDALHCYCRSCDLQIAVIGPEQALVTGQDDHAPRHRSTRFALCPAMCEERGAS